MEIIPFWQKYWNHDVTCIRQVGTLLGYGKPQVLEVLLLDAETLDAYVTCIRQVGTLLGYGKPRVLEVLLLVIFWWLSVYMNK